MDTNLNTLALILGILGGLAAALVYFRGAWDKGTIASLKESRDAYRELAEQREVQLHESEATLTQLTSENKMLTALVTRAADVKTLTDTLTGYAAAVESQGKHISESLSEILKQLRSGPNGNG